MRRIGILLIALSLLFVGCDLVNRPIGEVESAALMCGPELLEETLCGEVDDLERLTYRQMAEAVDELIGRLKKVRPSAVYEGHHFAVVSGQDRLLERIEALPADEQVSILELRAELIAYADGMLAASIELDEADLERLHAAGCHPLEIW